MRPPGIARRLAKRAFATLGLEVHRIRKRPAARPQPPAVVARVPPPAVVARVPPPAPARPSTPPSPHRTLAAHVAALLERLGIELVLDVGGNVGAYGRLLRGAGYRGRIASFEPVAAAFSELAVAAADDPGWSAHNIALGRTSETRTITVMDKTAQSSFLDPSELGLDLIATLRPAYEETVQIRRLDEIFDEVASPLARPRTYLKMDTQGFDLEVFAGAAGCLDAILALQTELSIQPLYSDAPRWLDALQEFESLGFRPTGLFPVGRDRSWRLTECDCVMVRD